MPIAAFRVRADGRPVRTGRIKAQIRAVIPLEALDAGLVEDAARLCGVSRTVWMRRTIVWEATRIAAAARHVPCGLHPGTPVYRVLDAPVAGVWKYQEEFRATGEERVWVVSMVEDAPVHVSPDQRAYVIDVVRYDVPNLLIPAAGLRWSNATPFAYHHWQRQIERQARVKEPTCPPPASASPTTPSSADITSPA